MVLDCIVSAVVCLFVCLCVCFINQDGPRRICHCLVFWVGPVVYGTRYWLGWLNAVGQFVGCRCNQVVRQWGGYVDRVGYCWIAVVAVRGGGVVGEQGS